MSDESGQIFDLSALLKIEGFDIRMIAKKDESLHTGDFFNYLSNILEKAPQVKESLNRIAELNGSDSDFHNMDDIKKDFVKVGCDKYLFDIEKIVVHGKDEKDVAAEKAKNILKDFDSLIAKIEGTKREKKPEEIPGLINADKTPTEYYETQLLHKALKILEHEESIRKTKILAVDDAPIILKTISSVLGEDYKVYGMTDPTTLEKFLKQITPELFLLDYKMPSLSGFDLIPIIRSFEAHKDTPIIFLTSEGKADNVSTALKLGACDYIVKPFQGKQLREKIAKHLGKKQQ